MRTIRSLCLALIVFCLAGPAARAIVTVVPASSLANPVANAMYTVNNSGPQIDVYQEGANWSKTGSLALPAGSQCYGLAVSPDGTKLYVSISAGSASKTRVYALDAAGLPTGAYADMTKPDGTAVYWSSSSAPGGLAVGGDNKLFVTDQGYGMLRLFDTSTNTWLSNVTDHLAGNANLYSVAVTPGTTSYKIYVSQRSLSGLIYVFTYNAGTVAYSKTLSTGLSYPTYLKVVSGRLFAAVNGTDGVDVKVYNTADESLLGDVKSGVLGSYGWTAFDVSRDGAWLVFKKALNADETGNRLYKVAAGLISGPTAAQEIAASGGGTLNAISSDGLTIDNQLRLIAAANSPTGSFSQYGINLANAPTVTGISPSLGAQGSTVTISNLAGTGFIGGATAKLARAGQPDIPLAATVVSSVKMTGTAAIPASASTGVWNVVVTNPDGQSASLSNCFNIVAPVTITTSGLPNGTLASPYNQSLQASGGTPPYRWTIAYGFLPGGLTLSSSGTISGTPTTVQTTNVAITATDANNLTATKTFSLTIASPSGSLTIVTASLPDGTIGVPYNQVLAAAGGTTPITWAITSGSLPAGLSLSASGTISGTPTAAQTASFTVQAADSAGRTASQNFSLTVGTPGSASLKVTTTGLPDGNVGSAYNQTVTASGGTPPYFWSLAAGSLPAGLALNSSGTISGTPTTAQTAVFTVQAADSSGHFATQTLTLNIFPASGGSAPAITTTSLPQAVVGTAYNQTLTATGGTPPYTWTVSAGSLPAGLTLNSAGAITGMPTTVQTANFTVQVADSAGHFATQLLSINVAAAGGAGLSVSTTSLPQAVVGTAYNQTLTATGGTPPYTWTVSAGSLPAGLTMNSAGAIAGTPTTVQTANFTVQAADSAGHSATQALSINVAAGNSLPLPAPVIAVSPAAAPAGTRIRITLVSGRSFGTVRGNSLLSFINRSTQAGFTGVSILNWSDTTIEAIVPALASGFYDLKVILMQIAGGALQELDSSPASFQITGSAVATGTATVYPCPFNAGAETVTLAAPDTGGASKIGFYVFDRSARLVFKQIGSSGQATWNGRDLEGDLIADGAYLIRILNEDSRALLAKSKLMVVKH